MAYPGLLIFNSANKQSIRFLTTARDTGGASLEMKATWQPRSPRPPAHYHPRQEEEFTVTAGKLSVYIYGRVFVLEPGDILRIPSNTEHTMWNSGATDTEATWRITPALETEYLLEDAAEWAAHEAFSKGKKPALLKTLLFLHRYRKEVRVPRPPYIIQQLAFGVARTLYWFQRRRRRRYRSVVY